MADAEVKHRFRSKRVNTPTVYQMEAVECGAASLAMILAYYGRIVPLEILRRECGVSRDGSKALNVLKAARKYGLVAKGYQVTVEELFERQLPAIIFWKFNHFLVIEGVSNKGVYLNDPMGGKTMVSHEEFDEAFTGVVLTFEVGPDFTKGGSPPSTIDSLTKRVGKVKFGVLYTVLAGLMLVVPGLLAPVFAKVFVDDVLVRNLNSWIKPLLFGMGVTIVFHVLLLWIQQRVLLRLETALAVQESAEYMWHVLRLPVEFFQQRFAGDLAERVQINNNVAQMIGGKLATTSLNLLLIVVYALVMISYSPLLATIAIIISALSIVSMRAVSRKLGAINERLLREQGKLQGFAMNGLQIIETLKASGNESDFFSQWAGYQAKVQDSQRRVQFIMQGLMVIPPIVNSLTTAVILGLGGWQVMDGMITIGTLVAIQSLMTSFLAPINDVINLYADIQKLRGDMNRLDDVLKYEKDVTTIEAVTSIENPSKLDGRIDIIDLTFGYSPLDPPLITNFNLSLKPGARVALVGRSGSGKSTLSKLISGIHTPWSGQILFDGKPRSDWARDTLVSSVSFVDQEIFLFEGTIEDNLTLWNDSYSSAQITQAAKDAQIHDVIASRPGGYASNVSEAGRNFSGGQAQRLEIARALVPNPRIVVLDEATSALDPVTEAQINEALQRRGVTTVVIAHRLSTIRDCDEIIVLDKGLVVQRGTHDELKNIEGVYSTMIASE
ncbi:MAG: NHLP family bacteriocin export ABC transporter peptidase/permease/ATPase subunit [Ignavibacteria bacterium]|jgi:NHLM bacteriocin system ABC transporter peptidase/ATP-binding protein